MGAIKGFFIIVGLAFVAMVLGSFFAAVEIIVNWREGALHFANDVNMLDYLTSLGWGNLPVYAGMMLALGVVGMILGRILYFIGKEDLVAFSFMILGPALIVFPIFYIHFFHSGVPLIVS